MWLDGDLHLKLSWEDEDEEVIIINTTYCASIKLLRASHNNLHYSWKQPMIIILILGIRTHRPWGFKLWLSSKVTQ